MKKVIRIIWMIVVVLAFVFFISQVFFQEKEEKNTSWEITQFGNNTKNQMMCYTIEGNKNGLIIIDGGYEDDEEMLGILEEKIKNHNNKVETWILTHFDTDHAGAYFAIRNRNSNLEVGNLYVQDTPSVEICKQKATWYNGWELYERYLNEDIKEKCYLHTGDSREDIIGLKLKVLCAYDDWIGQEMDNLLNNGSLVFKLYGNDESFLVCGDVQHEKIEEFLIQNYGEDLKSDYLQVAHHGNNSFSDEFYKRVSPKVAFFPAPESIITNAGNVSWFRAPYLYKLLKDSGTTVYYYKDSPAKVLMK